MERFFKELNRLEASGGFSDCIKSVDDLLKEVEAAKRLLQQGHENPAPILKALSESGQSIQAALTESEKALYSSITKYGKAIVKLMGPEPKPNPSPLICPKKCDEHIQKAILMHLIRIGEFDAADSFMQEAQIETPKDATAKFQTLYRILDELKTGNIRPAIEWATNHSKELDARGSNLEFLLHKHEFLRRLLDQKNPVDAIQYAAAHIQQYNKKHVDDVRHMMGAVLFVNQDELDKEEFSDLIDFVQDDQLSQLFQSEYCALVDLPPESPLFLATKAGSIALPILVRIERVMQNRGAEWTTKWELPVEIDLPRSLQYHNIFVCPVSKEQTTDRNPPMMLKCCHIISLDTLSMLEGSHDGHAFKCPYCPQNCTYYESKRVCF